MGDVIDVCGKGEGPTKDGTQTLDLTGGMDNRVIYRQWKNCQIWRVDMGPITRNYVSFPLSLRKLWENQD